MKVTPIPKQPKRKTKRRANRTKGCDTIFGRIIRSRGACENCGRTTGLQAAHGFSRRYRAVRWDERNCFCLDAGCHLYYTMRPLEWDDWMRERLGIDLYYELRLLATTGRNPDLDETLASLKAREHPV